MSCDGKGVTSWFAVLRIWELGWYEHCLFKGPDTDVDLHVFSARRGEIERTLCIRDQLRQHVADWKLYERTKQDLAQRTWIF